MERQDLLPSVTIDEDFPGKASHCNTFFLSLSRVEFRTSTQLQWAKTLKAKKVKGGKRATEKQEATINESTDSLRNALIAEMSSLG